MPGRRAICDTQPLLGSKPAPQAANLQHRKHETRNPHCLTASHLPTRHRRRPPSRTEYLWIDSLCIIQDSTQDWLQEVGLMEDVYTNSICNIAASHSSDGHGGLFRKRNPHLAKALIIHPQWENVEDRQHLIVHDRDFWKERINNAPLNKRGWVLQERLLTSRTGHTRPNNVGEQARASLGISKRIQHATHDDYLAGLWRRLLPAALLWAVRDPTLSTRPHPYQAPTWSWASIDAGTAGIDQAQPLARRANKLLIKLLDCTVTTVDNSAFSAVTDAYLRLQGMLYPMTAAGQVYTWLENVPCAGANLNGIALTSCQAFHPDTPFSTPTAAFCLPVQQETSSRGSVTLTQCLVLVPTRVQGQYTRFGYFESRDDPVGVDGERDGYRYTDGLYEDRDGSKSI
ncbi:hypothetical protein LAWI1_G006194, partial [Lachnellula willkommii]